MPDESILREKARVAVQSGKLPGPRPDRTWGAPGVGDACAVCELPVRKDEMESEIQFEDAVPMTTSSLSEEQLRQQIRVRLEHGICQQE